MPRGETDRPGGGQRGRGVHPLLNRHHQKVPSLRHAARGKVRDRLGGFAWWLTLKRLQHPPEVHDPVPASLRVKSCSVQLHYDKDRYVIKLFPSIRPSA